MKNPMIYDSEEVKARAGYIGHRIYKESGALIVAYKAADQGIDAAGCRYAVSCELHGYVMGVATKRQALKDLRHAMDFCEWCCGCVLEACVELGYLERVEAES